MLSSGVQAKLLQSAKARGGQKISNAKQKYLPDGSLLDCVRDEVAMSPVVRQAVKEVFEGCLHFKIANVATISTPPDTPPQIPHADDTSVRELFAVVHLLDDQKPTMYEPLGEPYDKTQYPEVDHAKLNKKNDLDETCKAQLRAAFGQLLDPGAPYLCEHPMCGSPPRAGDGMVALPTLIHRGPGTVGSKRSRHVLFFSVRPIFPDGKSAAAAAAAAKGVYDESYQIHKDWLLFALEEEEKVQKEVQAMYSAAGYVDKY